MYLQVLPLGSSAAAPYNMTVGCPVSVILPETAGHDTRRQQAPVPPHCVLPAPAVPALAARVPLTVGITAPAHMGAVHGWRGHEDNPEELEGDDARLSLLAAVCGAFYPVDIHSVEGTRVEVRAGGRAAQVDSSPGLAGTKECCRH